MFIREIKLILRTNKVLDRSKIAEFISTEEGRRAFENIQYDIITLYPGIGYLENDISNSTNSFIDTELRVAVEAGKIYSLEAFLTFQSANAGTGIGIAFTLPTDVSLSFEWQHNFTPTTKSGGYNNASGTVSSDSAGVPVINSNIPLSGSGLVKADNSGDIILRFRSSNINQVTLKGGLCVLRLNQVV